MRKNRLTVCLILAGVLASLAASGCYERVVSAKGPGAANYQVQDSYQENNKIDNWFWKKEKRD